MMVPRNPSEPTEGRFWETLESHGQNIALIEGERILTYAQLSLAVRGHAERLTIGGRKLAFLAIERDIPSVICYLALLLAGHAVFLCSTLDPDLIETYRPDMILPPLQKGLSAIPVPYKRAAMLSGRDLLLRDQSVDALPGSLSVLLSTSGSTGTSKLVRLSRENITIAAGQMRETLQIAPEDRAITSMPLYHVYGLSILHSQLAAGGAVVLTRKSAMEKSFWAYLREKNVTVMGGVPWTYRMMREIGVLSEHFPTLRKLHQSGAKLDGETSHWLCETFSHRGADLYFMYGQTEACGRICVLPPGLARTKTGSVGFAVPGGCIETAQDGEIVYSGPNVMLGYARRREDLYRGNEMNGVLHTGDLGKIDEDGCLYLSSRKNRLCKLMGSRINLDDLETLFPNAAITGDDAQLTLYFEDSPSAERSRHADMLADHLRIPRRSITLRHVMAFPRSATGKIMHDRLHAATNQSMSREDDDKQEHFREG